jgi:hypothetical protein
MALIDSAQLESSEALDKHFRDVADDETDRCRRDMVEHTADIRAGQTIDDATLLREAMNTVGKEGKQGIPDFIVQLDDGKPDPLNLTVEIKCYRREDAKEKANTCAPIGCWA